MTNDLDIRYSRYRRITRQIAVIGPGKPDEQTKRHREQSSKIRKRVLEVEAYSQDLFRSTLPTQDPTEAYSSTSIDAKYTQNTLFWLGMSAFAGDLPQSTKSVLMLTI